LTGVYVSVYVRDVN